MRRGIDPCLILSDGCDINGKTLAGATMTVTVVLFPCMLSPPQRLCLTSHDEFSVDFLPDFDTSLSPSLLIIVCAKPTDAPTDFHRYLLIR